VARADGIMLVEAGAFWMRVTLRRRDGSFGRGRHSIGLRSAISEDLGGR
jgi:hypothetical protein